MGEPVAEGTKLGPLASRAQQDRVAGYIATGLAEGPSWWPVGQGAPEGLSTGFYFRPTVFSEVRPDMTIAQEEILVRSR